MVFVQLLDMALYIQYAGVSGEYFYVDGFKNALNQSIYPRNQYRVLQG